MECIKRIYFHEKTIKNDNSTLFRDCVVDIALELTYFHFMLIRTSISLFDENATSTYK